MPPARALHEWRKLKKRRVAGFEPTSALSYQSVHIYCFKGGLADYNAACRGRCMGKKGEEKKWRAAGFEPTSVCPCRSTRIYTEGERQTTTPPAGADVFE